MMVPAATTEEDIPNEINLHAVASGTYIPLEDVSDEVFSSKMMGDGFAIEPLDGSVYAPVRGIVTTVFPSKHAIGIRTANGIEVLVHMGIDTVSLGGEGFDVLVKEGDSVTTDTKLAQMDLAKLREYGKATVIIVLITNMDRVAKISPIPSVEGQHAAGALLENVDLI